jgi:hypothetical protein
LVVIGSGLVAYQPRLKYQYSRHRQMIGNYSSPYQSISHENPAIIK